MSKVSFTLAVTKDEDLPMVLIGIAHRVPEFTCKDARNGPTKAFLITVEDMGRARAAEILDNFPAAYVHSLTLGQAA